MSKIFSFSEYLKNKNDLNLNEDFRSKTPLYPMGYGGIGLYPTLWFVPYAADSVLYITQDERLYSNGDGPPFDIRHLPGHKQYGDNCNNGDHEPFSIKHVPGDCKKPQPHGMPGKEIKSKGFVKLAGVLKTLIPPDQSNLPPK